MKIMAKLTTMNEAGPDGSTGTITVYVGDDEIESLTVRSFEDPQPYRDAITAAGYQIVAEDGEFFTLARPAADPFARIPDSDDAERHQFDKPADAKPDLDVPAVLAEVAAIIRRGAETGLPVPGYITYSTGHASGVVSFQFGTPYDVERWAFSRNEELTRTHYDGEPRGHTVYRFPLLTDDDSAIDCYCLVYDAEPVPGLAEHTAAACDTIAAASN